MDIYDKSRNQAERVLHWNLERNGLELFPSLEHQMLTEVEQEFTEAVFTWDTLKGVCRLPVCVYRYSLQDDPPD